MGITVKSSKTLKDFAPEFYEKFHKKHTFALEVLTFKTTKTEMVASYHGMSAKGSFPAGIPSLILSGGLLPETFKSIEGDLETLILSAISGKGLVMVDDPNVPKIKLPKLSEEGMLAKFFGTSDKEVGVDFDAGIPDTVQTVVNSDVTMDTKAGTIKIKSKNKVVDSGIGDDCSLSEMESLDVVKLSQANRLYAPVAGSDGGSRYHVIGISPKVNVAARIKGVSVSVRLEGVGLTESLATKAGLKYSAGSHASLHIKASPTDVKRVIGAILCDLGLDYQTKTPKLDLLVGKGV